MNNTNIKIEKKCVVCGKKIMKEDNENPNFDCPFCMWNNNRLSEENEDLVIFPNLTSLNKAKRLYKEGKSLAPDLNDFLDMFEMYGEVGFEYKGISYGLYKSNGRIELSWGPNSCETIYFKDKSDFIKNAKIDLKYIRDIWENVKDPCYIR